jgi:Predicted 3'-5' exonuclease related to the exonuclease domain of PolB
VKHPARRAATRRGPLRPPKKGARLKPHPICRVSPQFTVTGERATTKSGRDLIAAFVDKIAALNPQPVMFNGSSFDLPVL